MTANATDRVSQALTAPQSLAALPLAEWDELVRQARQADLLARLTATLDEQGLLHAIPPAPRAHLAAAGVSAAAQRETVRREIEHIRKALRPTGIDIVLLKGAAYLLADLPAAKGRLFSDIDILVPKEALAEVESALMLNGWAGTHHDAYDQRYYRQWMHELPPLQHITRLTVLDVHHAILPETARLRPDARKLLAAAQAIPGAERLRTLAPVDMVLHSATHLFHNEELSHGLRDLSDLDLLLRHFGRQAEFWGDLCARARELDLVLPLHYGLRYAQRILGTPVPPASIEAAAPTGRSARFAWLMDALWLRALRPAHATAALPFSDAARFLLYLRAHWLRMPPLLLARHLAVKAVRRKKAE